MKRGCMMAVILLAGLVICLQFPVQAYDITTLPYEITAPGTYELKTDLSGSSSWYGILISSSDVILEGNNHLLSGVGNPGTYGIVTSISPVAIPLRNITIQNVRTEDWDKGVALLVVEGGFVSNVTSDNNVHGFYIDGVTISLFNNTVYNNVKTGIVFSGANSTINNNSVGMNTECGILFQEPADENIISNNSIFNNQYGISLTSHCNNTTISNNEFRSNDIGIRGESSYQNKIIGNHLEGDANGISMISTAFIRVKDNVLDDIQETGIRLEDSLGSTLENNSFENPGVLGIVLSGTYNSIRANSMLLENSSGILADGDSNSFSYNVLTMNSTIADRSGMYVLGDGNFIGRNILYGNSGSTLWGMVFDVAHNGTLVNNTIQGFGTAILLSDSSPFDVYQNLIENNNQGILIYGNSDNTTIYDNVIIQNHEGLILHTFDSVSGLVFNNIFNNTVNVNFTAGYTPRYNWNITNTLLPNIIGGPNTGGNYWASPNGTGFSQTNPDLNGDGFCEVPYIIDANNADYLPLTNLSSLLPDLRMASIDGPVSGTMGNLITVDYKIENSGPVNVSPSQFAVFLSQNLYYDPSDIVISYDTVPPLTVGLTYSASLQVMLPTYPVLTPGSYYLGGYADANNSIIETNESNNVAFAPHMIQIQDTAIHTNLSTGWNLFSTPVRLHPGNDTLVDIFDAPSFGNITAILGWDGTLWYIPLPTAVVSPLYAYAVHVNGTAHANLVPDDALSSPPVRSLPDGIHLVGPAPAYQLGSFRSMPLDQAFVSIEFAPGGLWGYTMVVSPGGFNQPSWVYSRGGFVQGLLPFKGYWVVMDNPDTLYGFSTTPIA